MNVSLKCRLHPSIYSSLPITKTIYAGQTGTIYVCFYVPAILTSVTSISGSVTSSNTSGTRFMWSTNWDNNKEPANPAHSTNVSTPTIGNATSLFTVNRQLFWARLAIVNENGTSSKTGRVTAFNITINGTAQDLPEIAEGDPITIANMTTLKSYIDTMNTKLNINSSYTLSTPVANAQIDRTIWQNYITKANAMPHVSGLVMPSTNDEITAAYYNNIVTTLRPSQ